MELIGNGTSKEKDKDNGQETALVDRRSKRSQGPPATKQQANAARDGIVYDACRCLRANGFHVLQLSGIKNFILLKPCIRLSLEPYKWHTLILIRIPWVAHPVPVPVMRNTMPAPFY